MSEENIKEYRVNRAALYRDVLISGLGWSFYIWISSENAYSSMEYLLCVLGTMMFSFLFAAWRIGSKFVVLADSIEYIRPLNLRRKIIQFKDVDKVVVYRDNSDSLLSIWINSRK